MIFPPLEAPGDGALWMPTPFSVQGLGDTLLFGKVDGDLAAAAVLAMSLNELLGGTASTGGRCEVAVVRTLSDFALARLGFDAAAPVDGLPTWMYEPELDIVRDETDRPAADKDGRGHMSGEAEGAAAAAAAVAVVAPAEGPNLRSGELGTDLACRAL